MTEKSYIPIDFSCFVPPPSVLENYRIIVQAHAHIKTSHAKVETDTPIEPSVHELVFG